MVVHPKPSKALVDSSTLKYRWCTVIFPVFFFVLLSFMTAAFIATSLCSDLSWISLPRTRDLCLTPFCSRTAELNIAHIYFKWRMRTYMLWEKCLYFFFFFPKTGILQCDCIINGQSALVTLFLVRFLDQIPLPVSSVLVNWDCDVFKQSYCMV